MYKIGQKVSVRLADGKVRKALVKEYVPDLFTHTHLVAVLIGKTERVISEEAILKDEKDQLQRRRPLGK